MQKFKITTNALALSKVLDIVNDIKLENGNIPLFSFSEDKEQRKEFATFLYFVLLEDLERFNDFFETIVIEPKIDNFAKLSGEKTLEILVNFTRALPGNFLDLIMKSIKELQRQRDMVMKKNEEMIEQTIRQETQRLIKNFQKEHPEVNMKEILSENG